jgi:hypothetical protein
MTNYVVTKPQKSVGLGILLTLLLGPIGLFYSSVIGGLVMTFAPVILLLVMIFGFAMDDPLLIVSSLILILLFAFTWWLICMIWAIIGVNAYNREILEEAEQQNNLFNEINMRPSKLSNYGNAALNDDRSSAYHHNGGSHVTEIHDGERQTLNDWLKHNPGKSINDFFSKHPRQ